MAETPSRSSGTSGSASKKTAARKTARKTAAKKSPAKKSAARQRRDQSNENGTGSGQRRAPSAEPGRPARPGQVAAQAAQDLIELTGRAVEGVTGLERTEDGWTVQVEVVELRRIPDTTDVLALYEVEADRDGSMMGYRRIRRYARGVPGED